MPGQSKGRGRQTELCSCPPHKIKHFRGQRGRSGHWAQPKWTIVLSQKNLGDHTAPNCGLSDTHTYKSHIYLHPTQPCFFIHFLFPLLVSEMCLYSSGSKEKKPLLQMDVMALVSPPTLFPVSNRLWARQTLCMSSRQNTQHATAVWLSAESGSAF